MYVLLRQNCIVLTLSSVLEHPEIALNIKFYFNSEGPTRHTAWLKLGEEECADSESCKTPVTYGAPEPLPFSCATKNKLQFK